MFSQAFPLHDFDLEVLQQSDDLSLARVTGFGIRMWFPPMGSMEEDSCMSCGCFFRGVFQCTVGCQPSFAPFVLDACVDVCVTAGILRLR